jgi:hypothetical protein
MDIRVYFQKIREIEAGIEGPYVVVISLETPEGGKAGCMTEVNRASAARLIVDAKVRLASTDEQATYYRSAREALQAAEEERMAGKIQLTVVSDQGSRTTKLRSTEKG